MDLKDIQLPESISWFPLAIGWWVLLTLVITAIIVGYFLIKKVRIRRLNKTALKMLQRINSDDCSDLTKLQLISQLLRRLVISKDKRQLVASLTGEKWLEYLDKNLPDKPFTQGVGRILLDGQYRAQSKTDIAQLIAICERWIRQYD